MLSKEQNEFCEKKNPTRKMDAGDQSVNEEGLIAQGWSGALQEDGSLYKAKPEEYKTLSTMKNKI